MEQLKELISEGMTDGKVGERIISSIIWGDSGLAPALQEEKTEL